MSKALTERNAEMWKRHEKGDSNYALSKSYGISEQRVSQIIGSMNKQAELPYTPKELALHAELHELDRQERILIERVHRVVTKRIDVHLRLDGMIAQRVSGIENRRADDLD
jgi:hypothetical protein